ncbi:hypothetical protein [Acidaminococcus fermentans]|uniref:hypothetical protein n=1 Tax=Acidaminococcus fermentans TaxID=905 RepID=UPI00242C7D2D|nr:hypothetical protein [Acidaminococcus fermentans]
MHMDEQKTDGTFRVIADEKLMMVLEDIERHLSRIERLLAGGEEMSANEEHEKVRPRRIKRSEKNVVPDLDKIIQLGFQKYGTKALEPLSVKLGVSPKVLGNWKRKVDRGELLKVRFNNVLKIANALLVGVDELIIKTK